MKKIPFVKIRVDDKITSEVVKCLNSGWITTGPRTKKFEQKISEYCGGGIKVYCCNSATAGLESSLRWFGVGEGDEVIIPAYTYTATASVVLHTGAKPVMVDVNDDFTINVEKLKEAITEKTKVIMPVDIAGLPANYNEINKLVKDPTIKLKFKPSKDSLPQKKLARIMILSDAAHSIGSEYRGRKTSSFSDISVFSFHAVKNIGIGEGGGVAINLPDEFSKEEIYNKLNLINLHGQNKSALDKLKSNSWEYDILLPGYKNNMTDLHASIGLVELDRYETSLRERESICNEYSLYLKEKPWAILPTLSDKNRKSSYHLYLLRVEGFEKKDRNMLISEMSKDGISLNVHYKPLPLLTAYNKLDYNIADFPNSEKLYNNEISLPVYYDLPSEDIKYICERLGYHINKILDTKIGK